MRFSNFCAFVILVILFSFQNLSGQTEVFWVGGSGDWNDINHWSDVSGGAGGFQPPNNQLDAIFDANSFTAPGQVVTVSLAAGFCEDLDWTGVTNNPTFRVDPAFRVEIGGSLRFSPDMTVEIEGNTVFTANTTGEVIQSSGQSFGGDIIFNGPGGEWTLVDEFNADGFNIDFESGSFLSNDQTITATSITSITVEDVFVNLGTSDVILFGTNTSPSIILEGDNILFQATDGALVNPAVATIALLGFQESIIRLSGDGTYSFGIVNFTSPSARLTTIGGNSRPSFVELNFSGDGLIQGEHLILLLVVANNSTLLLENGTTQFLSDLQISGNSCEGDARVLYQNEGGPRARLDIIKGSYLGPFYFRGIDFLFSGTVTITGGFNGGNNSDNLAANTVGIELYWVNGGNDGDWSNPANWSMTSGGAGGACIPKASDNVIFDNMSFLVNPGAVNIMSSIPVYLNSFTFGTDGFTGDISMPSLTIIAQITLSNDTPGITITEPLIWQIPDVFLNSTDRAGNSNQSENVDNLFIDVIDRILQNLHLDGDPMGRVKLSRDLRIEGDLTIGGNVEFDTQGFDLSVNNFTAVDNPITLDLDNSTITIRGMSLTNVDHPLTIRGISAMETDGTHWIFESGQTGFTIDMGILGDVTFLNDIGTSRMSVSQDVGINRLTIMNDGVFTGLSYDIDSLIFSNGHRYELGAGSDVVLNEYFEALGESCATITFETSGPSISEDFTINAPIESDLRFMVISNIDVRGGTIFAGTGSIEGSIGSTSGWTFPTEQENEMDVKRLGEDIVACNDSLIVFSPYAQNEISSIEWFVNGSTTVASTNPSFQIPPNATEVRFSGVSIAGCPVNDTVNVNFSPSFTLIPMTDTTICQGAITTLDPMFTDPSATFSWSTGDDMPTIDVSQSGEYSVIVDRGGCVELDTVIITRIDLEPFSDVFDNLDSLVQCEGEVRSFTAPNFTNASYVWNDGTSTPQLEVSQASLPNDNMFSIVVTEDICTDSLELYASFDPAITQIMEDMSDTTICRGDEFDLSVIPGFDSVMWNTGSSAFSIPITTEMDLTYNVMAYRGACIESEERNVFVTDIGTVDLGADLTDCEVSDVPLQLIKPSNVDPSFDIRWIEVSSGDVLSVVDTLTILQAGGTVENYVLEATSGLCSTTDTVAVTIETAPILDIGVDTTICAGSSLDIQISQEPGVTYTWSTNEMGPMITVSTTDTFRVSAERGRCLVDSFISVTVLDLGALDLGPDTTLCQGESIMLDATLSGSVMYDWFPANLGSTFNVIVPDEYQVTVSASGCEVSDTIVVDFDVPVLFDLHRVAGAFDTTICNGETWSYNDLADPAFEYVWQDGIGDIISMSPDINIVDEGGFTLSVTNGSCITEDSINIILQELPALSLQDTISACQGETINLDATTGMATYLWSSGENSASIDVVVDDTYIVTATEFDCPNSDSTVVMFNALPDATLPADRGVCEGDSILLSFADPGDYNWQTPSGSSTEQSLNIGTAGEYIVQVTNADNCTATDTFNLSVNLTPIFDLPDSLGLCDGASQPLTANFSSLPSTLRWSTADANASIIVRTNNAGPLWLDASTDYPDGTTCSFSDTTFVSVQVIPDVVLPAMASICSDSTLVLDATTPGVSYLWSTQETTPTINVTTSGTYSVTVDIKGCTDADSIMVETRQAPDVVLGMDTTICSGETLTLTTGNSDWSTSWSTGESTASIDVAGGTLYSVTVEDNGCFDSDNIRVDTSAIPVFDLGEDIAICNQTGTQLSVTIPNVTVLWSTGETTPSISTTSTGTFSAVATSIDGCSFEDDIEVSDRACVRFEIYRPNAFSPNAIMDTDNRSFIITPAPTATILNYEINIFNRWGNLVFTSNDINISWDGSVPGFETKLVDPGVYVYDIEVTYSDDFDQNRTDRLKGTVTLID